MKIVIYDLETLSNFFSACFRDVTSRTKKEFILYDDIKQVHELVNFLLKIKKFDYTLAGINVIRFDSQIVEFILASYNVWFKDGWDIKDIVADLYAESQRIISVREDEVFDKLINENDLQIRHVDFFKQKHYDGKAKRGTSLKWLQFTMRYHTVEEMPIHHASNILPEQIPDILGYNWNDVDSTEEFFNRIKFETDLRVTLSQKYDRNLLNASEPRMVREIFGKLLSEAMGISYKELKKLRTDRKEVRIGEVLFPYIKFKTKPLQQILKAFQKLVINVEAKGEFSHTFKYHDIDTVLGLGGIHACINPGVYEAEGDMCIHDIDVVSFYPNLAIENNWCPEHLPADVFLKIYKHFFDERKIIPKVDPINYIYKIILNSLYGLSKEVNSYFYDPKFTYGITINGQLSILMLVEALVTAIPSILILQENTDGVTIKYDKKHKGEVAQILKDWKALTKLDLEEGFYKKMIIRDVNNYIAVYEDEKKKPKKKGAFETELDYHKNPSYLVVPKAVEAYFVYGVDYKRYILECKDIYDFLGAVKKKSGFDLNLYFVNNFNPKEVTKDQIDAAMEEMKEQGWYQSYGDYWVTPGMDNMGGMSPKQFRDMLIKHIAFKYADVKKIPQQKVTRFYISQNGGQLIKDFLDNRKAKQVSVIAKYKVTPLNKVENTNALDYDIDYQWYIRQAEKLIFEIQKSAKQLLLL